jgi:hypothetical protein
MLSEFTTVIFSDLIQKGYILEHCSQIPGVKCLSYFRSSERIRLGFAKVEDHFLFIDWDQSGFDNPAPLIGLYQNFSHYVNQDFSTPHVWRITIPNLAIIAISQTEFPAGVLSFARTTDLVPWYGGEVGQVILVNIRLKQIVSLVSHQTGRYPKPGAFPLKHAATLIRQICRPAFDNALDSG